MPAGTGRSSRCVSRACRRSGTHPGCGTRWTPLSSPSWRNEGGPPHTWRRAWLRRVTVDLTGLPPTPEEVEAFLADGSPDADERVVDRLLRSPGYGERWAQHWLDVVRFAETEGYEYDRHLPDAWRYRDYV